MDVLSRLIGRAVEVYLSYIDQSQMVFLFILLPKGLYTLNFSIFRASLAQGISFLFLCERLEQFMLNLWKIVNFMFFTCLVEMGLFLFAIFEETRYNLLFLLLE